MSRFIFLDRDGTLIHDEGYTYRVEDYRLLPQAVEGLQAFARQGFRFAILTNQSGIGRGFFSEAEYQKFEQHLHDDLRRQGVIVEASFFCPHAPEENCSCRKPASELFQRAENELGAVLSESWMIGDKLSDLQAGLRVGCRGQVWSGGGANRSTSNEEWPAHLTASDLLEAARAIAETEGRAETKAAASE